MLTEQRITSLVEAGRDFARDYYTGNLNYSDVEYFMERAYTRASEYDFEHEAEPSDLQWDMIVGLFIGGALGERFRLLAREK